MTERNKKLAEFVGIMLGDGYLRYPKGPRIKITLNTIDDKEYLNYVRGLLLELFGHKIYTNHRGYQNASDLFIFRKKVVNVVLDEVGLLPSPKWDRATIPSWAFENFPLEVLRGYFDTDGCVVITNNNGVRYPRLEMKVSPSPMQQQFISILRKLEFNFGVYDIGKGKVRIQMNGKTQLSKWRDLVGFSNPKHKTKCKSFFS